MALIPGLMTYWNRNRLLDLVDQITARVQNVVWQRVRERTGTMGVHEARGYIRARAARVIDQEMALVVAQNPTLPSSHHDVVLRSVRHRVVRRLLLENLRRQDTAGSRRRIAA